MERFQTTQIPEANETDLHIQNAAGAPVEVNNEGINDWLRLQKLTELWRGGASSLLCIQPPAALTALTAAD